MPTTKPKVEVQRLVNLRVKQYPHASRRREDFAVRLKIGRTSIIGRVELLGDDGSIPANRGKWYAYFRSDRGRSGGHPRVKDFRRFPMPCPRCVAELATPCASVIFPLLEARGFRMAHTEYGHGGWSLFDVYSEPLADIKFTGNNRVMGEELVLAEYQQPLRCPVHGRVMRYDNEPID